MADKSNITKKRESVSDVLWHWNHDYLVKDIECDSRNIPSPAISI
jgi:hypothetical protein